MCKVPILNDVWGVLFFFFLPEKDWQQDFVWGVPCFLYDSKAEVQITLLIYQYIGNHDDKNKHPVACPTNLIISTLFTVVW